MIIYIGFSKPKNNIFPIASWLIRLFMGYTSYSHVYIRWFNEKLNMWICYQANGSGVNFCGPDTFEDHIQIIEEFELDLDDNKYLDLLKFCISKSGYPYGYKQNLGIMISKLLNLKHNIFSDKSKSIVCSELASLILKDFFNIEIGVSEDMVTPKDIYDHLHK